MNKNIMLETAGKIVGVLTVAGMFLGLIKLALYLFG